MCPFIAFLVLFQLISLICDVTSVNINIQLPFNKTDQIKLQEGTKQNFSFVLDDFDNKLDSKLRFKIRDSNIADVDPKFIELYQLPSNEFRSEVTVNGIFVGFTKLDISFEQQTAVNQSKFQNLKTIDILTTVNDNQILSQIFTVMVAVLVSLNTINMGCALDMQVVKETVRRPTAIFIGFFTHYFFMPLFGYIIGKYLFEDTPYLRLSLFIFGCSPGGSAANMWTVLLGGNLNLSITMTFISTLFAVVMMPLWLFTLGANIFETNYLQIPYRNILTSLFILAFCIGIGLIIQRFRPKLAKRAKRILAPVCGFLIAFIIIFASFCYWYLFKLMTWKIILAATLNVWLGFLVGAIFAALFKQKFEDLISIVVETGIQNTGIVFIIIRVALSSPERDFAMTIPIASSCITAAPLFILFIILKCRDRSKKNSSSNQKIYNSETLPIKGSSLSTESH